MEWRRRVSILSSGCVTRLASGFRICSSRPIGKRARRSSSSAASRWKSCGSVRSTATLTSFSPTTRGRRSCSIPSSSRWTRRASPIRALPIPAPSSSTCCKGGWSTGSASTRICSSREMPSPSRETWCMARRSCSTSGRSSSPSSSMAKSERRFTRFRKKMPGVFTPGSWGKWPESCCTAQAVAPGIQVVPASGTRAMAAASMVSAAKSSGSRLWRWFLPQARASVWASSVKTLR